jgi:predicted ATP-dependent serine protease
MEDGLLLCPACGSMDLMPDGTGGKITCEACGAASMRHSDQCPNCGERGLFVSEQIAFPAPGQSPKEAPSRIVKTCDACGYVSR